MIDLIDNPDREFLRKALLEGVHTDFWQIIKQALENNIHKLEKDQLLDMQDYSSISAEECKIKIGVYNAKKAFLEGLKYLPESILQSLEEPILDTTDDDVYRKPKDFLPKYE